MVRKEDSLEQQRHAAMRWRQLNPVRLEVWFIYISVGYRKKDLVAPEGVGFCRVVWLEGQDTLMDGLGQRTLGKLRPCLHYRLWSMQVMSE